MEELDELKEIWQTSAVASNGKKSVAVETEDAISKYQRKVKRTNVLASVYMTGTVLFLISLMFIYNEESWLFYLSVSSVVILSIAIVLILWTRRVDASKKLILSAAEYTDYQLKKLKRSKRIIQFSPLYGLLLGICVNAYAYSLLEHASGEFVFWMTNINWLYIMVVSYASYAVKMRRYLRDVQPIVDELEAFKR